MCLGRHLASRSKKSVAVTDRQLRQASNCGFHDNKQVREVVATGNVTFIARWAHVIGCQLQQ